MADERYIDTRLDDEWMDCHLCSECGSVVIDREQHDRWHDDVRGIVQTHDDEWVPSRGLFEAVVRAEGLLNDDEPFPDDPEYAWGWIYARLYTYHRAGIDMTVREQATREIDALRALISSATVEEMDDTEWYCPATGQWSSCSGVEFCEHDQSRTVIRRVLSWKPQTRAEHETLHRALRSAPNRPNQTIRESPS